MNDDHIRTVSEITHELKDLVEVGFPDVFVLGEISNCTRAGSGHVYLTLKDELAQLRAVIWRGTASRLKFDLEDGLEVVAGGSIEVYAARGTYQLIVKQLMPRGIGTLELAFRQLQQKLEAEGLFDIERKRPLPRFPRKVALITSPTGAAVRDMLQVMTRRWRGCDIVILPVAVQGQGAAQQIADAFQMVERVPGVDVVITGRGGGSLEDLWAFNEEVVARAIFNCSLPVVSAVGHEIDVSISDLVADRRALTPSEAAELVVPETREVQEILDRSRHRLLSGLTGRAERARMQLDAIASRPVFTRPLQRIHDLMTQIDELEARLKRSVARVVDSRANVLSTATAALQALNPLGVLARGYSVTRNDDNGTILRNADEIELGSMIKTQFESSSIVSRVESINREDRPFVDLTLADIDVGRTKTE